jgi:hypothetical protein
VLFTGPQIEQLRDAIADAFQFDPSALEQMVLFKLGKPLYKMVQAGPLDTVAFKLIALAEQEGWVRSLVYALALVRPNNDKVKAFCTAHAPWAFSPPDPEELITKVTTGLGAVSAKKSDPGVQQVINRFREDLRAARDGTAALNKYKKLHDRLHALQVMFSQQLAGAAEEARKGSISASLDLYAYQFRDNANKARAEAAGLPTQPLEVGWAALLDQVASLIEQVQPGNAAPLDRAGVLLQSVLSEATRINARLTEVVAGLRLGKLVEALGDILPHLTGTDADAEVRAARDGLTELRPRLDGLMQEHYEWQVLDKTFSIAEVLPGNTLADRFPGWENTHKQLENLFDLSPKKPWAVMLRKQVEELEKAGQAGDTARFARAFGTFRIVARDRFMDVDTELLNQSGYLADVAPALDKVVS